MQSYLRDSEDVELLRLFMFGIISLSIHFKVACISGLKCLYYLINYFQRKYILMTPHINLFHKMNRK